ncbi:MAG: nucleotidyltransferase family protein [Nitrosotalea sp.]
MKAVILSGGLGKRLKPITDYIPKPLVPIDNTPVIEWQIRYFKKFGVREFVICAGYRSEQIVDYLDAKDLDVSIDYSIEKTPLGTGGAIKRAGRYIDGDSFYVINGDVMTNLDLKKMKVDQNSIVVIPLRTGFGLVHLLGNKVKRFEEKPEVFNYWMNAGLYCLQKDVLKYLPKVGNIENTAFPELAKKGMLHVTKFTKVFWHSIDSHKDMEECTREIKSVKYERFLSK